MTGPTQIAAQSMTAGACTTTLCGVDPWILVFGLGGALVAMLHISPAADANASTKRTFALLAGSMFLAGTLVPVAVAGSVEYLPWLVKVEPAMLQRALAFLIGSAPFVGPVAWRVWRDRK